MLENILEEISQISNLNKDTIKNLYDNSDSFNAICTSIFECRKMIKELSNKNLIDDKLLDEYKLLHYELKEEFDSIINKHTKNYIFEQKELQ